jgi:hypothetical protein
MVIQSDFAKTTADRDGATLLFDVPSMQPLAEFPVENS